nr:immunoglobulin heavy chain junction region [Mus musculus]
ILQHSLHAAQQPDI